MTKLSGTQSQELQQCDREAPQESRWHRGKADAKERHYGHRVFVAAFSPSTGCFQRKIWLSLSREAASKLLLAVVWQRLWRWARSYKLWLPSALLVFLRNMGRIWLGFTERSKYWESRLCSPHYIKMKAWTGRFGKVLSQGSYPGLKRESNRMPCSGVCRHVLLHSVEMSGNNVEIIKICPYYK